MLSMKVEKRSSNKHVSSRGLIWWCPWGQAWVYLVMFASQAANIIGTPLFLCIVISRLLLSKQVDARRRL